MKHVVTTIIVAAASLATATVDGVFTPTTADSCGRLPSLKLPHTTILAESVPAGAFSPSRFQSPQPTGALTPVAARDLPEFCRVAAVVKPVEDSEIGFELWLPTAKWNGKFIGIGNGGFGGLIPYERLSAPLALGYAAAATDTGHQLTGEQTMKFVLGHPNKLIDFEYRAVHETTVKAKLIVAAYYGRAPTLSYWNGCSQGGRQGLMEAQRFPADYDGVAAGDPVSFFTHLQAAHLRKRQAIDADPAGFVPAAKLALIHSAVLKACDGRDGVDDGVVEDPRSCDFDPKSLECEGADGPGCLTAPQVEVVHAFYAPTVNPRTHEQIFPGLERGGELGWSAGVGHMAAQRSRTAGDYLRYAVFQDAAWDYKTFDFDTDVARADRSDNSVVNAVDPNLKEFFQRGGRLLQYHGWSDESVSPRDSINYYSRVVDVMGGASKVHNSYRLFMVPGMFHCGGGDGPSTFDSIHALEQWVEARHPPDRIIASHFTDGKVDRTRPLCPYPQLATYNGAGSTDEAANFSCKMP